MYSYEIKQLLDSQNWHISSDLFNSITSSSPQIIGYKREKTEETQYSIYFYTNDGLSGSIWFDNYIQSQ